MPNCNKNQMVSDRSPGTAVLDPPEVPELAGLGKAEISYQIVIGNQMVSDRGPGIRIGRPPVLFHALPCSSMLFHALPCSVALLLVCTVCQIR